MSVMLLEGIRVITSEEKNEIMNLEERLNALLSKLILLLNILRLLNSGLIGPPCTAKLDAIER